MIFRLRLKKQLGAFPTDLEYWWTRAFDFQSLVTAQLSLPIQSQIRNHDQMKQTPQQVQALLKTLSLIQYRAIVQMPLIGANLTVDYHHVRSDSLSRIEAWVGVVSKIVNGGVFCLNAGSEMKVEVCGV